MNSISFVGVLSLILTFNNIDGYSIPSFIQKCHFGDDKCIVKTTNYILTQHSAGVPEMGLRPLDPYDLEVLSVASANKNAPISITATIRNPIITGYGHPDGIAKSIKGFVKDINNTIVESDLYIPTFTIKGLIRMEGKLLLLPLTGSGVGQLKFKNLRLHTKARARTYMKDGKEYVRFVGLQFTSDLDGVDLDMNNFFGTDKALNDAIISTIQENWRDFFNVWRKPMDKTFADNLSQVLNTVFALFPYADFFLPDD